MPHPIARSLALVFVLAVSCEAFAQDAADIRPAVTGIKTYTADLTGAAEVPDPGDADGTGEALIILHPNRGEVCFRLTFERMDRPTAAHIHEGAAGVSGPPVVPLDLSDGLGGCSSGLDAAALRRIITNPAGFYVNLHNADHPAGAVRGQLMD